MPNYAKRRQEMLRVLFDKTGGDPQVLVGFPTLADELKIPVMPDTRICAQQLAESKLAVIVALFPNGGMVSITMKGVEQAEKMERSALRRFYEDHFALAGIVLLILSVVLNRLVDLLFRALGWQ